MFGLGSYWLTLTTAMVATPPTQPRSSRHWAESVPVPPPPLFSGTKQYNPKTYLVCDFGSFGIGPECGNHLTHLTPDKTGLLEGGHTLTDFIQILRTGYWYYSHPSCSTTITNNCLTFPFNGNLFQVMQWSSFQDMTDRQLTAIYTYLSAVPCLEGGPGEPPHPTLISDLELGEASCVQAIGVRRNIPAVIAKRANGSRICRTNRLARPLPTRRPMRSATPSSRTWRPPCRTIAASVCTDGAEIAAQRVDERGFRMVSESASERIACSAMSIMHHFGDRSSLVAVTLPDGVRYRINLTETPVPRLWRNPSRFNPQPATSLRSDHGYGDANLADYDVSTLGFRLREIVDTARQQASSRWAGVPRHTRLPEPRRTEADRGSS